MTGRDNYRACGEALGVDLESEPDLVSTPTYAALSAGWFWHKNHLNNIAADILAVTKKINDALKVALKDPEFIKRQEALGALVATDKRIEPAEHKAFVADQINKLKTVIDAAGQYAD